MPPPASKPPEPAVDVIGAIRAVMAELEGIDKGGTAPAKMGGYKFRGIEQILGATQKLCAKHGVVFAPHVRETTITHLTINGQDWTDTRLLVSYDVYGPGGNNDSVPVGPVVGIGRDNTDKGSSKAMSTAYKQVLTQIFQIGDSSTDTEHTSAEATGPTTPPPEMEEAMAGLAELIAGLDDGERQACRDYLVQRFGAARTMTLDEIRQATAIAAGWPATMGTAEDPF